MITYLDQNNNTISINPEQVCYIQRNGKNAAAIYFTKDFHLHVPSEVALAVEQYMETKKNAFHLWARYRVTPNKDS